MGIENKPLISVIIPVYNVESYLNRCLESVIKQIYHNLQIILIDDGSTDSSGNICDRYALLDSRILIIHTDNKGVAEARNTGLENANGHYVSFVDADDYINRYHFHNLYETLIDYNTDISVCGHYLVYEDGLLIREMKQRFLRDDYVIKMDRIEALTNMLYKRLFITGVWGKLFKTDLLTSLRFQPYRKNEDLPFLYRYISLCNDLVYTNIPTYYYFQRNDSLVHSPMFDTIPNTIHICQEIKNNVPLECRQAALSNLLTYCFYCYCAYPLCSHQFAEDKLKIRRIILSSRSKVLADKNAPLKVRGACLLSYIGLGLTHCIYAVFMLMSKYIKCFKHSK